VDERIVLWTMNKSEMSSSFLIDPFLSRHFDGIFAQLVVGWNGKESEDWGIF
jgi:hypothetical protein